MSETAVRFDPGDSGFYDLEYFLSMEYRYFSRAHRTRVRNLVELVGQVQGKSVLDVGGGGGFLANEIARRGGRVHLVDYSSHAIAFARSRFPDLEATECSVYEIDRLGKRYDVVTCFDVVEHLAEPDRLLAAAAKVVNPEGRLFLSTDNESSPFHVNRFLAHLARATSHLSGEGRDFNMIKRVESYRRRELGIDYHRSHVSALTFEEARRLFADSAWEVVRYRTYHLYQDPVKSLLSFVLGPKSGAHMAFECRLRSADSSPAAK